MDIETIIKKDNSNFEMVNFYSEIVDYEIHRLQRYKIWITYLMLDANKYSMSEIAYAVKLKVKRIEEIKLHISKLQYKDRLLIKKYGKHAKDVFDNLRSEIF